ncbi:MAG: MinD/ParA family protein [Anaerolineae bacterium]|nr:MinD/ParA family protein [Anaerolineae bacterium]
MNYNTNSLIVNKNYSNIQPFRSRVLAVVSGKGGVGKTNVAVNLGLSLARRGLRVALLDADLGTANVDVVLGLHPRYHLQHVVTGQKTLSEIIVEGPFGLQIIPGASGLPDLADLPEIQRQMLLQALLVLDGAVDLLLIDTGAGVGQSVIQFILAAGEMLVVTTPEPTSITDAYALMKVVSGYQMPVSTKLVINNVQHRNEGEATGHKLATVAHQFLGRQVEVLGVIPSDKSVRDAVKMQSPLLQSRPYSPAARAINHLGEQLWAGSPGGKTVNSVGKFLRQMLSLKIMSIAIV